MIYCQNEIVYLRWLYTPLIAQQDGTLSRRGMERGLGSMGHAGGLIVGEWPCILPTLSLHERVKEIS